MARYRTWDDVVIEAVASVRNQPWIGRTLGEYAAAKDTDALEALFDLAVEENLEFSFSPEVAGADDVAWAIRAKLWQDDRCIIGASDAGAHLDIINTFAFSTQLLGEGVRERGLISLEEAVRRITAVPAARFGLKDRGLLAPGMAADIVVFDPDEIACGPVHLRHDLPGGQARLYAEAPGVRQVIVNGVTVVRDGEATGKLGGRILRSGRDTETVPIGMVQGQKRWALEPAV